MKKYAILEIQQNNEIRKTIWRKRKQKRNESSSQRMEKRHRTMY